MTGSRGIHMRPIVAGPGVRVGPSGERAAREYLEDHFRMCEESLGGIRRAADFHECILLGLELPQIVGEGYAGHLSMKA
jgi:hypothetical protein